MWTPHEHVRAKGVCGHVVGWPDGCVVRIAYCVPYRREQKIDDDIFQVINNGELADYIRGQGNYENLRPEVDYYRWRVVSKFYMKYRNADISQEIIQVLIELLNCENGLDFYAVAGICLNIEIPELDAEIGQRTSSSNFFRYPDNVVSFVSKYVMKKQLSGSASAVVENAIRKNHIEWIITGISTDLSEQNSYWEYCEKVIHTVLINLDKTQKESVEEKIKTEKQKTIERIERLRNLHHQS